MKKLLIAMILAITVSAVNAQAHVGCTERVLKSYFPDDTFWKTMYPEQNKNQKIVIADFGYGEWYYNIDLETGLVVYCSFFPSKPLYINSYVELYNSKYVPTSTTTWTAYLDGGGILKIELYYGEECKCSFFSYYQK